MTLLKKVLVVFYLQLENPQLTRKKHINQSLGVKMETGLRDSPFFMENLVMADVLLAGIMCKASKDLEFH